MKNTPDHTDRNQPQELPHTQQPDKAPESRQPQTPQLPPVSNRFLYGYRIFGKLLSFFFFGLGSFIIATGVFPLMKFFLPSRKRFKKHARHLISALFRVFIAFMRCMGIVSIQVDSRQQYRALRSCIVVANHPSLLDVVFLISLIPEADCIVNAGLDKQIVKGVINQLYLPNSLDFSTLMQSCTESLKDGNVLIIFPEGTRSLSSGQNPYKRGAARIALESGCPLVPVHIGGTDKYGLRKHNKMLSFNRTGKYVYDFTLKPPVLPQDYASLPVPVAARKMTEDIAARLAD